MNTQKLEYLKTKKIHRGVCIFAK